MLSVEEACRRYKLSHDEIRSWQSLVERHGLQGLRVTRLREYRFVAAGHGGGEAPDA